MLIFIKIFHGVAIFFKSVRISLVSVLHAVHVVINIVWHKSKQFGGSAVDLN